MSCKIRITETRAPINFYYWHQRFIDLLAKDGIIAHMHYFSHEYGSASVIRPGKKDFWRIFRGDPWWGSFDYLAAFEIHLGERKLLNAAKRMAEEFCKAHPSVAIEIVVPESE